MPRLSSDLTDTDLGYCCDCAAVRPGHVLASLAAKGVPKELSGKFVQWDAADLAAHQNPNKTRE